MSRVVDLTGQRFARLLVLGRGAAREDGKATWLCQCDCGNQTIVMGRWLRIGQTKSCGCWRVDVAVAHGKANRRHGASFTPTYGSWAAMRSRCTDPNASGYEHYGGRGIKVCSHWDLFENFLADMGERPQGMTLDRYPDVNGNYEPGNCRWATPKQQQRNRRNNRMVEAEGGAVCLAEFAEMAGIKYTTARERLNRAAVRIPEPQEA